MTRKDVGPVLAAALPASLLSALVFFAAGGWPQGAPGRAPVHSTATARPAVERDVLFEPSAGRSRGDFLARGPGYALSLDSRGSTLALGESVLRSRLVGGAHVRGRALQRTATRVNVMTGDRKHWKTGLPTFGRVAYSGVYPGIDLVYHGKRGALEYDFELAPGADPGAIGIAMSGARTLSIAENGDLVANVGGGTLRQHRPIAYQGKRKVRARFALEGDTVRFVLGRYDRSEPLVIDPVLAFADYVGGTGSDGLSRVAVDAAGNMYVVGTTASTSIPGSSATKPGGRDAFVVKIAPSGARQYISYIGGHTQPVGPGATADDFGNDIGVDSSGRAYIVGKTGATDFPDTDGSSLQGTATDAFYAGLNANGTIRFAGYMGTADADTSDGVAVNSAGDLYMAMTSNPTPSTGTGSVLVIDRNGTWTWTLPFDDPGSDDDSVNGVALLPGCSSTECEAYITGHYKIDDPDTAAQKIRVGYITRWNFGTGLSVWFQNFTTPIPLDGGGQDFVGGEAPAAAAVDPSGNAVVIGTTTVSGHTWAFVVRFGKELSGGNVVIDSPLLTFANPPNNGDSAGLDVATDAQGNLYMAGWTGATNGDKTDAVQPNPGGAFDGYVIKYFPDGPPSPDPAQTAHPNARIVWATFLGGATNDFAIGIATDTKGGTYVSGETGSNFLTPATQDLSTPSDGFVVKIETSSPAITEGPSGTIASRDATFKYTAKETGGTFSCRLIGPADPSPGFTGCSSTKAYTGLADGSYTFEVKVTDSAGTSNGRATSRAFAVDTSPKPSFTIAPNPALVGRAVTFDASASSQTAGQIAKFEWDLDGNGSFEKDTGATATVSQVYPAPGTFTIGLRVTTNEGRTGTATGSLQVNFANVGSQLGVTINKGAKYTNDPDVVVTSTFPSFTTALLFSNDGGFGEGAKTFAPAKDTKWKLDSSGPERLPKTIYVRFLAGSIAGETHQDDIILDETPPKVSQVTVAPAPAAASRAVSSRKRSFTVKVKAKDSNSGVSLLQVTANKKKPGKALRYKKKLKVRSAKRPKWVRARDRAGNWSRWKKAR